MVKALLLLCLILVILGVGAYTALNRGVLPAQVMVNAQTALFQFRDKLPVAQLSSSAGSQLQILSTRSQEVGSHVGNVLGSSVEVGEHKQPIHQKAFEYARYQYCQQVIKEYEAAAQTPADANF